MWHFLKNFKVHLPLDQGMCFYTCFGPQTSPFFQMDPNCSCPHWRLLQLCWLLHLQGLQMPLLQEELLFLLPRGLCRVCPELHLQRGLRQVQLLHLIPAEPASVVNRATMTNLYTYFFHTTWPGATFPFSMRHVISSKVVDFKKNIYFCKLNYHMIQQFHFWIVIWRKWNHLSWKDICTPYSLQHCLQYLRYRNNLSVHQQVHGFKKCDIGPSMMVQGLTLCSSVEGWSSIPAQGTRSCMPQLKMLHATAKIPCAPSKTWCNQINF